MGKRRGGGHFVADKEDAAQLDWGVCGPERGSGTVLGQEDLVRSWLGNDIGIAADVSAVYCRKLECEGYERVCRLVRKCCSEYSITDGSRYSDSGEKSGRKAW